jgi:hypothetical protein
MELVIKFSKIKILTILFVLQILFFTGCSGSAGKIRSNGFDTSTPEGMTDYLRTRRLPAIEEIKLWESKYGKGLEIKTRHYNIRTTLMEPLMLSQLPGFVEAAYRAYQNQLFKDIESTGRMDIYLFAQRKQWEDFTKEWAGKNAELYCKIKSGAYCLNGACVAYNIGREKTFSVLGHEGWHQFNSRFFKYRLPSWIDEGVATLFEANRYEKGNFYFEPSRNLLRLGALKQTIQNQNMLSLEKLVSLNPGEVISYQDRSNVMGFYAQTYALVRFLREDDYGKRLGRYHQLLTDALEGKWQLGRNSLEIAENRNIQRTVNWNRKVGRDIFRIYISSDFKEVEQEYLKFCRKIVYYIRTGK